jgi:putative FmdB family regulatory protein
VPLYEYQCDTCGHRFEVIQKFSDEPLTECPKCQGSVRKLPSSPAIQFKGSGWYITDYAKKSGTGTGPTKSEGADKPATSSSSGDSSSGSAPAAPSKPTTSSS